MYNTSKQHIVTENIHTESARMIKSHHVNPKIKASEKYAAFESEVGIKKNRTAAGADIARECTWM